MNLQRTVLQPRDAALALGVVAVWGTNFVVIRFGLGHLPPVFFAFLRFLFVLVPAAALVRRPAVGWRNLAGYGVLVGAGQFGVLYVAMRSDISPGLASLAMQSQVFFTVGLAAVIARERVRGFQLVALALAAAGLLLIAVVGGKAATPLGLGLTLVAAMSWGVSNLIVKSAGPVNMLGYVVWASLFSAPPLLLLSLVIEGPAAILHGLREATAGTWLVVAWQSVGNTMFGFGAWSYLLTRYPAATVTPTALLVPVFGLAGSALVLGEPLEPWKLGAAALVVTGLVVNLFWPRWAAHRALQLA